MAHMGNRLFVGNLPFEASEQDLRTLLGADGRVVSSVKFATHPDTGKPRGFAFVDMADEEQAKAAIAALDGKDFQGRPLKVNEAMEKPGSRMGSGAGNGGGFGGKGGGFRDQGAAGFGSRGPAHDTKRGSMRGGGRGGGRGS